MDARPRRRAGSGKLTRVVTIRPARLDDGDELSRIDFEAWTLLSAIAPRPDAPQRFFPEVGHVEEVLVAEVDGAVAGYIRLMHPTPFPASAHVLQVRGLAVDEALQRRGIGRALVEGALDAARERGMRRVTLRVLAPNAGARALYASCGFVVEGVLRGEFHLDGRDVDDVFMAYTIA